MVRSQTLAADEALAGACVVNHKTQLLENEIEPKDNKIGEMKQQILAMEEELTAVVKDQA